MHKRRTESQKQEDRKRVVDLFYSINENTVSNISKITGLTRGVVHKELNNHFEEVKSVNVRCI